MSQMFPPDMLAGLMGGAAPQPAEGAMPPDIEGLLAGLGGGAAGGPEGAPAPEGDPNELYNAAMDATDDPVTLVEWAVQSARKAAQIEADDENTLLLEKATTALQQYKATLQKEDDEMLQGKSSPKSMRRVAGSMSEGGY